MAECDDRAVLRTPILVVNRRAVFRCDSAHEAFPFPASSNESRRLCRKFMKRWIHLVRPSGALSTSGDEKEQFTENRPGAGTLEVRPRNLRCESFIESSYAATAKVENVVSDEIRR